MLARRLVVPSACPCRTACRRLVILDVEPVAAVCIACRASASDLVHLISDPAILASLLYLSVVVVVASASAAAFPAPRAPHTSVCHAWWRRVSSRVRHPPLTMPHAGSPVPHVLPAPPRITHPIPHICTGFLHSGRVVVSGALRAVRRHPPRGLLRRPAQHQPQPSDCRLRLRRGGF